MGFFRAGRERAFGSAARHSGVRQTARLAYLEIAKNIG